jgi:DNA-binding GntR family transcriptional regulator
MRKANYKLERERPLGELPQSGLLMVDPSREEIEETFGIRSVLESYAARLAAIKHEKEELGPLEEKIEEFQHYLNSAEMEALPRINTEFHNLLYGLSKSPTLIKMINDLQEEIYSFRRIILNRKKVAKQSNDNHRQIFKAMKERDPDRVETLVRKHVLRGQKLTLKELGNWPSEM